MVRLTLTEPSEASVDPFGASADPERYVPREATERALAELVALVGDEGRCALLLGLPGIGKTLLLRLLSRRLAPELDVVHLPYAALPPAALCIWALEALGAATNSFDPAGALANFARRARSEGRGVVLLVDDADTMPEETASELVSLVEQSKGALRFVAAADRVAIARLEERFGNVPRVQLVEPMTPEETARYIGTHLAAAGVSQEVIDSFDPELVTELHDRAGGNPGRVSAEAGVLLAELFGRLSAAPEPEPETSEPLLDVSPPELELAAPEAEAEELELEEAPWAEVERELELEPTLELDVSPPELELAAPEARAEEPAQRPPATPDETLEEELPEELEIELPEAVDTEASEELERAAREPGPEPAPEPPSAAPLPDPSGLEEAAGRLALAHAHRSLPQRWAEQGVPPEEPGLARAAGRLALAHAVGAERPDEPAPAPAPEAAPTPSVSRRTWRFRLPDLWPRHPLAAATVFVVFFVLGGGAGLWLTIPEEEATPRRRALPPVSAGIGEPVNLHVVALPPATILLDGESLGLSPIIDHEVPSGTHRIEAQFDDGRVIEKELEIDADNRMVIFP